MQHILFSKMATAELVVKVHVSPDETKFDMSNKHKSIWTVPYTVIVGKYTGGQMKGYIVIICLLFYKTEWHIRFAYCKHNQCCFRVDLPNLNQVQ